MLDIEQSDALLEYLRSSGRIARDETPEIDVLAGGVSNRTVLVTRPSGEAWVLKQALEKLRVKVDWFSDPKRIEREALGIEHLSRVCPSGAITPLIFRDEANHLLAMAAVPQPHENWKTMLLRGDVRDEHVKQFAELLACIHKSVIGRRIHLDPAFSDTSFFESLRLEPYYLFTAEQVPEAATFVRALVDQTRSRRITLVHGDYSPKNILIHNDKLILLDHEVIHYGDPAFDVGFAMTHLLSKAHHLEPHREKFKHAAELFWETYHSSLPKFPVMSPEPIAIQHTLACLLARVAGRSPLEYLDDAERKRQREVVVQLMQNPPATMNDLIEQFVEAVSCR
jgi:aminoglycoside phosphotransferase (APT) family kinase protein